MGSMVIPGKEDLSTAFLGKVLNKFYELCRAMKLDKMSIGGSTYLSEKLVNVPNSDKFEWIPYVKPDIIECGHLELEYKGCEDADACIITDADIDAIIDVIIDDRVNANRNHFIMEWQTHNGRLGRHQSQAQRKVMKTEMKTKTKTKVEMKAKVETKMSMRVKVKTMAKIKIRTRVEVKKMVTIKLRSRDH
ncbi:hypothetical protein J1N35_041116 [Gossypium stocksii]|uniref:Uncharacterized protein n=1 Tax=Gossypium stocksii TaxID=47602 RepID=A0A9D3ZJ38_9ROSI|nr:hypothetical protein J1N35_041116 [Gossypium stocksii]